jgi:hypothetical protein
MKTRLLGVGVAAASAVVAAAIYFALAFGVMSTVQRGVNSVERYAVAGSSQV